MERKMTRVDICLILHNKGGRIKKGRYEYTIFSKDYPKGPGNPIGGEGELQGTTVYRLALQCLVAALQRIHRPSIQTAGICRTDTRVFRHGKKTDGPGREIRNCAMQISGSRWTSCSVAMQCASK